MKQLENKVAVVTGANQGIGLAITRQFAEQGAVVYAFDIKEMQIMVVTPHSN